MSCFGWWSARVFVSVLSQSLHHRQAAAGICSMGGQFNHRLCPAAGRCGSPPRRLTQRWAGRSIANSNSNAMGVSMRSARSMGRTDAERASGIRRRRRAAGSARRPPTLPSPAPKYGLSPLSACNYLATLWQSATFWRVPQLLIESGLHRSRSPRTKCAELLEAADVARCVR